MHTLTALTATAELPAANLVRLAAWAEVAREALAPNTLRGYHTDTGRFRAWCELQDRRPLPATPETVVAFLQAEVEAKPYKVGTLRRRAASIGAMHRAADLPNPCEAALVRLELKGLARRLGTGQRQAAPLTERDLHRIRARMGDTVRDLRDQALLLVGRDLLARASELVALRVEDVTAADNGGALVALRRLKTDTEARPYLIGPETRAALEVWLRRAGIDGGLLFRSVNKAGKASDRGLSTRDVGRVLKGRAMQAQLNTAAGMSAHSMRTGMACDLVARGTEMPKVMTAGGWSTPSMVARYTAGLAAQRGAIADYYGLGG